MSAHRPASLLTWARRQYHELRLPGAARRELARDRRGAVRADPGPLAVIEASAAWLARAQDRSAGADGGVARDYSLIDGWAESYPETTGYIVPTMLAVAELLGRDDYRERARRMLDWLVSIQMDNGAIQGGMVQSVPRVPVTFNTGQVLIGLAAGVSAFGERYLEPMHAAARFLRDSLDDDGCWRRYPTPFAKPGEKAYETHVSWGLFEAERVAPGHGYAEAGMRQVAWAVTKQESNGWVRDCCLVRASAPLTHTLGYYLKGLVEAHRHSGDADVLVAARRTADGLLGAQRADGALPGRLSARWEAAVDWICLTGIAQIAGSWRYLYCVTGEEAYRAAARRASAFVRTTVDLDGPDDLRGGVKGSLPVDGAYGAFQYLNWAAKFTIDASLLDLEDEDG